MIVGCQLFSDHFSFCEIHRCTFHRPNLSCRNRTGLFYRCKRRCLQSYPVTSYAAAVMSIQVKVSVVRHIHDRCLIRFSFIVDLQLILICQGIGHGNREVPRISLVSIRAVQMKRNTVFLLFHTIPEAERITVRSTVQVILSLIFRKVILCPIQHKSGAFCPVCPPSDCCPEESSVLFIIRYFVISKHNILALSRKIFHLHGYDCRSETADLHTHSPNVAQRIGSYFSSIFCGSKYCFFDTHKLSCPASFLFPNACPVYFIL